VVFYWHFPELLARILFRVCLIGFEIVPGQNRKDSFLGRTAKMLSVTLIAREKLIELTKQHSLSGCSIRIQVVGAACSGFQYKMTFDKRDKNNDEILDLNGCQNLFDTSSWMHLQSTTLDYTETAGSFGFQFLRPNQNHCDGCGGACK
jgi:iron-sulfur cluster assembly protein